jgi:hypothetical protein
MKCLKIIGLGVLLGVFLVLGCMDGMTPYSTRQESEPPAIQSLSVHPMNVLHGSTVTVTAVVEDTDDESLEYEWSVSSGSLIGSTNGHEVLWATPDTGNSAVISCIVRNESGSDGASANVYLATQDAPTAVQLYRMQMSDSRYITDASPATDGGCYAIGTGPIFSEDIWIAKLSVYGTPIWEKTFPNPSFLWGNRRIESTPDGGCIITGLSDYRPGYDGSKITKLSQYGNVLWEITLPIPIGMMSSLREMGTVC